MWRVPRVSCQRGVCTSGERRSRRNREESFDKTKQAQLALKTSPDYDPGCGDATGKDYWVSVPLDACPYKSGCAVYNQVRIRTGIRTNGSYPHRYPHQMIVSAPVSAPTNRIRTGILQVRYGSRSNERSDRKNGRPQNANAVHQPHWFGGVDGATFLRSCCCLRVLTKARFKDAAASSLDRNGRATSCLDDRRHRLVAVGVDVNVAASSSSLPVEPADRQRGEGGAVVFGVVFLLLILPPMLQQQRRRRCPCHS
jgi:hypothetical protein